MNDREHIKSHIDIAGDLGQLKAGQEAMHETIKRLRKDFDRHLHNDHGHPMPHNRTFLDRDRAIKGGGIAALIAGLVAAAEVLSRVFGF